MIFSNPLFWALLLPRSLYFTSDTIRIFLAGIQFSVLPLVIVVREKISLASTTTSHIASNAIPPSQTIQHPAASLLTGGLNLARKSHGTISPTDYHEWMMNSQKSGIQMRHSLCHSLTLFSYSSLLAFTRFLQLFMRTCLSARQIYENWEMDLICMCVGPLRKRKETSPLALNISVYCCSSISVISPHLFIESLSWQMAYNHLKQIFMAGRIFWTGIEMAPRRWTDISSS